MADRGGELIFFLGLPTGLPYLALSLGKFIQNAGAQCSPRFSHGRLKFLPCLENNVFLYKYLMSAYCVPDIMQKEEDTKISYNLCAKYCQCLSNSVFLIFAERIPALLKAVICLDKTNGFLDFLPARDNVAQCFLITSRQKFTMHFWQFYFPYKCYCFLSLVLVDCDTIGLNLEQVSRDKEMIHTENLWMMGGTEKGKTMLKTLME